MSKTIAPYGSWPSSITSSLLTSSGVSLSQICSDDGHVYWAEGRPLEGGRVAIVRDGVDVLPREFNVRTRAHEYGGDGYAVRAGSVFFVNFSDQRLYRQDPNSAPRAITPEPAVPASVRYADLFVTPDKSAVVCVRERHHDGEEAVNDLVVIPADVAGEISVLAEGHDFYSSPCLSSDGKKLAWLTWDHPNMPWDGTELWVADYGSAMLSNIRRVVGGSEESIFQPAWAPDGTLHYISDRTGWWNLYAGSKALAPMEAEFGLPQWIFGLSRYGFLSGGRIACIYTSNGLDHLALLDTERGTLESFDLPYTSFVDIRTDGDSTILFIAGSATIPMQVVSLEASDGKSQVLKTGLSVSLDAKDLSVSETIEYPTARARIV